MNLVAEQVKRMPPQPGVYLFKDAAGAVLYVGKAARLRHRVRSYFSGRQQSSPKLRRMVARVADVDFFVTGSEEEALVLELNLIKRYRPYYNVRLKDDKNFPYLKIDPAEDWPRVQITRRLQNIGGRYFGPFASASSIRRALKVIKDIFPFRPCSRNISRPLTRPCLEYDIHNCSGPCIGAISREEYAGIINQLTLFLEGKQEVVVRQLEDKMKQAAAALEYETAARTRDQLRSVREIINWQRMATTAKGEQDVIACAHNRDQAYVQVYFIRGGKLIGREGFTLQGTRYEKPLQIMTSFVKHFYDSASYIPPLILLQHPVEGLAIIESWLKGKRGSKVRLQVPAKGDKKQLIATVAENAARGLEQISLKHLSSPAGLDAALKEIKNALGLQRLPLRIEGYDVSNVQGQAAVGSMVVFDRGRPLPAHYRRFRIKTVAGADDYAMLGEVVRRRFGRLGGSAASWSVLPDTSLLTVAGGS